MKPPSSLRFNFLLDGMWKLESYLEDIFMSKETKVLGPAGTTIVFNGAQPLHSGGLIELGEQIALQVNFGHVNLQTMSKQIVNVIRKVAGKTKRSTRSPKVL